MFWRQNHVGIYNRLNPKCAAVFHPMVDVLSPAAGGGSSASYFDNVEVRAELDQSYASGRNGVRNQGDSIACENLHMQIVLGTQRHTLQSSEAPELFGMATAIPVIRRVVFGFGPGMAEALDADPYDVTLRSCFVVAGMLGGIENRNPFVEAARDLWQKFYDACVEDYGQGDFYA